MRRSIRIKTVKKKTKILNTSFSLSSCMKSDSIILVKKVNNDSRITQSKYLYFLILLFKNSLFWYISLTWLIFVPIQGCSSLFLLIITYAKTATSFSIHFDGLWLRCYHLSMAWSETCPFLAIYFVILSKIFQHYLKLQRQICFGSEKLIEVIPLAAMSSAVIIVPDNPESI